MAFFQPSDPTLYAPGPMPVYSIEADVKGWYGHPLKHEGWVKVANDLGPTVVLLHLEDLEQNRLPGFVLAPVLLDRHPHFTVKSQTMSCVLSAGALAVAAKPRPAADWKS